MNQRLILIAESCYVIPQLVGFVNQKQASAQKADGKGRIHPDRFTL
jgi:hypothetical protein